MYLPMFCQELLDVFSLVRGEIVEHDVSFLGAIGTIHQTGKKRDEFTAGMSRRSHAVHFTGPHIQTGIKRERAVR